MKEKKGNKLVAMIMAGIAGVSLVGLTGCTINIGTPSGSSNSNVTSTSNTGTPVSTTTTQTVSINGYSLELPSEYYTYYKNGYLYVQPTASNPSWLASVSTISNVSFSSISAYRENLKTQLTKNGATVNKVDSKNIAGQNWIFCEASYNGYNYIYAYGDLTSNSIFYVALISKSNTYDYTPFNQLSSSIYKAKTSPTRSIDVDNKLKIDEIPSIDFSGFKPAAN